MNKFLEKKKNKLSLAVAFLILFSWSGLLDSYSAKYTDSSIFQAGIAYATARGINAVVSMLQTSTVEATIVVGGSITVGEVLDPINDMIERFSTVMTIVLGSLMLQKILLIITADSVFNVLVLISGAAAIGSLWQRRTDIILVTWKVFILLIFVRFSIAIIILMNSVLNQVFIDKDIDSFSNQMVTIKNEISTTQDNGSQKLPIIEESQSEINVDAKTTDNDISEKQKELVLVNQRLNVAATNLAKNFSWYCRKNPFCTTAGVKKEKENIANLKDQKDKLSKDIDEFNKQNSDDTEGLWDSVTGWVSDIGEIKKSISPESIANIVADNVDKIIRLLMLFILKTILTPLLFFYFFIAVAKAILRFEWEDYVVSVKE